MLFPEKMQKEEGEEEVKYLRHRIGRLEYWTRKLGLKRRWVKEEEGVEVLMEELL